MRVEIFMFLLDLRVSFDDVIVAVQTLFHRRNPRKIRVGNVGMAILALYLLDPAVHIVAEGDRLFGAEGLRRPYPENIDKSG